MQPRPLLIQLPDRSAVRIWPETGRATVAAFAGGTFDREREPCQAGDFAGRLNQDTPRHG